MRAIGVDTGGTFTDAVVLDSEGGVGVGKALSTPQRPALAVVQAIRNAAVAGGWDPDEILSSAEVASHGTTVGLNALLTGSGARVGLLTTKGFEDTLPIARMNKVLGLDEELLTQATRWEKPPPLLPPRRTIGVAERVCETGEVVVPLDEEQARAAAERLRDEGVEAVGISLLWSFRNPAHEERLAEIVREVIPGAHVTVSSRLAPRLGEYERTLTVVLNAYVAPTVSRYLDDLEQRLRDAGFAGTLLVMQSGGGVQRARELSARPVETLRSGPVGGVEAAAALGRVLGHQNVVSTDVGGTSFDVGLVIGGRTQFARRPMIGRYSIATTVVDVESIGTGGGSIAYLDPETGALRVGPASAGADPGPACYGRGGTAPTVTDAAVVLGYMTHLGGELDLDAAAARRAVGTLTGPLGRSLEEAAEAILAVSNAQMADLVRRVTVRRGHDPREFVLYAFGGAAAQYAGRYAVEIGVAEVVVPVFASVFSAFGAIAGDLRSGVDLDAPQPFPPDPDWLRAELAALGERVTADLDVAGRGTLRLDASVRLRFRRQTHELRLPLPEGEIDVHGLARLGEEFTREYERLYGPGTAYAEAGIELVGIGVEGRLPLELGLPSRLADLREPSGERHAWFDGARLACPVWDGERIASNVEVAGPAFVDTPTTTVVVYPGQRAAVDDLGNVTLRVA